MAERRSDTRQRIQQVALELFTEQGYDKTSLREIAERLEVTKAALYYHFKSKEDIVTALIEDMRGDVTEVVEWASGLPRTPEHRAEIVRHIPTVLARSMPLLRFAQVNETALRDHPHGEDLGQLMWQLLMLLSDEDADAEHQLRSVLAMAALMIGMVPLPIITAPAPERMGAAVKVALELVTGQIQSA
ncbi:TetR family transcriptional regulator [Kutzneria viridogrisea]|uniref:AcrR family transcriptional regulator n=1 Tax=Kutzneria viridogrisea TaxID=47990 RepID=A0ABR6BAN5_9PSEU|nr:AcrR family transcriptional regulator [Kutzneria viridogrisea]